MKIFCIFALSCCTLFGQNKLTENDISTAMQLVQTQPLEALAWADNQPFTAYDFGMMLLGKKKSRDALLCFTRLTKETKGNQKKMFFFGKAWCHYHRGEIKLALDDGLGLLKLKPEGKLKSRTHHLLAVS